MEEPIYMTMDTTLDIGIYLKPKSKVLRFRLISEEEYNNKINKSRILGIDIDTAVDGLILIRNEEAYTVYHHRPIIVSDGDSLFCYSDFEEIDFGDIIFEAQSLNRMFLGASTRRIKFNSINLSKVNDIEDMFEGVDLDLLEIDNLNLGDIIEDRSRMFNESKIKELRLLNFSVGSIVDEHNLQEEYKLGAMFRGLEVEKIITNNKEVINLFKNREMNMLINSILPEGTIVEEARDR